MCPTGRHHAISRMKSMAQPSTEVEGRAGRCLVALEQSSRGLVCAVERCLLTIALGTGMVIGCATWQDCTAAGQLGRPSWILGEGVQSAGLGNRAGHLGSWARVYSQLGWGTGPGWGTGWGTGSAAPAGLGNRPQPPWSGEPQLQPQHSCGGSAVKLSFLASPP